MRGISLKALKRATRALLELFIYCNQTDPLESYPNLAKFFTRHLKPGVRPIADNEIVIDSLLA
jgi:phosphatidylserine decarboxylase